MSARIAHVRNVNGALDALMTCCLSEWPHGDANSNWRINSPRGMETIEWRGVYVTEYGNPCERVLFSAARDANPFFHFFEALWILDGRQDVEFLAQFNNRMRDYSDDGIRFHAAYGHRLRKSNIGDQLIKGIELLNADNATRQVVLTIWDPRQDLGAVTRDLPCNDLLFFKVHEGRLDMTVACRSNDAIWGAYGANAVQFSTIQEFVAAAIGVEVGVYVQVSDSFHIYTANDAYQRLLKTPFSADLYMHSLARPYPLVSGTPWRDWLRQLEIFLEEPHTIDAAYDRYFTHVAAPIWAAWNSYKRRNYDVALSELRECVAEDWAIACTQWIERRLQRSAT